MDDILKKYNLTKESKIDSPLILLLFLTDLEKYYEIEILESELFYLEKQNLNIREICYLYDFIKWNKVNPSIHHIISSKELESARPIYSEYIKKIRESKLSKILDHK